MKMFVWIEVRETCIIDKEYHNQGDKERHVRAELLDEGEVKGVVETYKGSRS